MLRKVKKWWRYNKPVITTKKNYDAFIIGCMEHLERNNQIVNWALIRPIIYDLEKLRANTWDQDKITYIQNWLKCNFEVKK